MIFCQEKVQRIWSSIGGFYAFYHSFPVPMKVVFPT